MAGSRTQQREKVLVLGASGETGQAVVAALEAQGILVRAQVRTAEKGRPLASQQTEVVITEVSKDALPQLLEGIGALISTIGTRELTNVRVIEAAEHTTIKQAIAAAREVKLQHFVLCSSMSTHRPESIPPLANVLYAKARAERDLLASGLTYTIVHPGGLHNGPGGQSIRVVRHPGNEHGSIARIDVAQVLVQALLQPEARNLSVDIYQQEGAGPATRPHLFVTD